jgi:hypothetical protein
MRISIDPKNEARIVALLAAINGRAADHTYTTLGDIAAVAREAEKQLLALLPKNAAPGAVFTSVSGGAVPRAYKYRRIGTYVRLERGSSAWFLMDVGRVEIYEGGGSQALHLTQDQHAEAVARFSKQYRVLPALSSSQAA